MRFEVVVFNNAIGLGYFLDGAQDNDTSLRNERCQKAG